MRTLAAVLATGGALGLALATAQAVTVNWDGSTDMTWSQPDTTSWSGATYNSGDIARFGSAGGGTVAIAPGGVTPAQIIMYSPRGANTFTFNLGENNALGTASFDTDYNVSTTFNNTKGTGSANTVTLANNFIYTNGYTLRFTGGDVRLTGTVSSGVNGGPSINPAAGVTVTLDNGVTGTADFTLFPSVAGSTVRLNGTSTANAYQVRQLTVQIGADNALGPAGATWNARQAVTGNGTVFEAVGGARTLNNNFYSRGFDVVGNYDLTLNGSIQNNEGYYTNKMGTSTLVLNGDNLTSGWGHMIRLREGVLRAGHVNALGTTAIRISGGVVELAAGDFTRALSNNPYANTSTVGWITDGAYGASGGFSAYGGNRSVNLGAAGAGVTWGSGGFVASGQTLIFGTATANAQLDFQNPINFNGAVRTIQVNDNPGSTADQALLSGALTNGGLTKTGDGTLALGSSGNTYAGGTTVTGGTLVVNAGSSLGTGSVTVGASGTLGGSGTIQPTGTSSVTVGGTVAPGASIGTLTFDMGSTSGTVSLAGATLDYELGAPGTGDLIQFLNYSTGDLVLGNTTLNIADAGGLDVGTYTLFTFAGGGTPPASGLVLGSGFDLFTEISLDYREDSILLNLAIPEPSALALIALGGALCLRRRR